MASYGYDNEYTGIRKYLNPQDPKVRIGLMVILGAVAVYLLWGAVSTVFFSGGGATVISDDWHVSCVKCNAESVVSRKAHVEKAGSGPLAEYPDCPKCGQKASCVDMTICPECGKRFASEAAKALRQAAIDKKVINEHALDLVCPHCKYDLKGSVSHE